MSEQVKFLSAVQRFLLAMANHVNFPTLRDEQYENCRLKIQQWPRMSMETMSEVVSYLTDVPFLPEQLSQLQLDVSQKVAVTAESAKPLRRPNQNYQNFPCYLTNSLWLLVLGDNPLQNALLPLARHLGKLGLRLPGEKTISKVTALLLYRVAEAMDQQQLHHMFELVKAQLRKELAALPLAGQPFIVELPHDPMQMPRSFFNEAFQDEQPVQCQVDVAKLNYIHSTIRERMPASVSFPTVDMGVSHAYMANVFRQAQAAQQPALPNLQINMDVLQRRGSFSKKSCPAGSAAVGQLALLDAPQVAAPLQATVPAQPAASGQVPQPSQAAAPAQPAASAQVPQPSQAAAPVEAAALLAQAPQPSQAAALAEDFQAASQAATNQEATVKVGGKDGLGIIVEITEMSCIFSTVQATSTQHCIYKHYCALFVSQVDKH